MALDLSQSYAQHFQTSQGYVEMFKPLKSCLLLVKKKLKLSESDELGSKITQVMILLNTPKEATERMPVKREVRKPLMKEMEPCINPIKKKA